VTITHLNLKEVVYKKLKKMIISHKLEPGTKIHEEHIAEELGVSRTPIREALSKLEQEGVVKIIPRRGAYIVKLSKEEIYEILTIREFLEALAVRLCTRHVNDDLIKKLRECFEDPDGNPIANNPELVHKADVHFHDIILNSCKSKKLSELMHNIYDQIQMLRSRVVTLPGKAKKSMSDHQKVIDALEKRDPDLAEKHMREHIKDVKSAVLSTLK
jgi:DNA-binding GntR family transcriptional regulator